MDVRDKDPPDDSVLVVVAMVVVRNRYSHTHHEAFIMVAAAGWKSACEKISIRSRIL
jgi:hypothetical protein